MQSLGVIRLSSSPWASPMHMVPKSSGGWRPCRDYRRLNHAPIQDRYLVPHIKDFSAHLAMKSIFSKFELIGGCHQIPVAPGDTPKTAIIISFGLFEFTRMLVGWRNASQAFQRLMDETWVVLCVCYIDDLLVVSSDETFSTFGILSQRLQDNGLVVNLSSKGFRTMAWSLTSLPKASGQWPGR